MAVMWSHKAKIFNIFVIIKYHKISGKNEKKMNPPFKRFIGPFSKQDHTFFKGGMVMGIAEIEHHFYSFCIPLKIALHEVFLKVLIKCLFHSIFLFLHSGIL